MGNLFLFIFFASIIALVVGLVKPTVFSRFIKGEITRKKIVRIFGISTFVFFVLFSVTTDRDKAKQTNTDKSNTEKAAEQKRETKQESNQVKTAILTGKDPQADELVVSTINVWQKAGEGGKDNVTVGTVPHNTKVEVIEKKKIENVIFYHIRSSVGEVSVLPTELGARTKTMQERPRSEWFFDADNNNPVDGWVANSFVIDL